MFYVIALAGAHKRVINQLREQLAMVGLFKKTYFNYIWSCLPPFMQLSVRHFISQEGRDKRFLIQKLCQAQSLSANKSPVFKAHPRSRSGGSPSYHTSFSSNFSEGVFLAHPLPDSSTHVWDKNLILQNKSQMQYWTDVLELNNKWTRILTLHGSFCGLVLLFQCFFVFFFKLL